MKQNRILSCAIASAIALWAAQARGQWLATPVDANYVNAANWTGGIINNDFSLDSSITAITLAGTQAVNSGTAGAAVAGSPFRIGPASGTITSSYTFSGGLFSAGSGAAFTVTAGATAATQTINTSIYQGSRTTSAGKTFTASAPLATSKFIVNGNYNYQTTPASGVTTAGISDSIVLAGAGYGVFNGIIADGNAAANGATVAGNVYVLRNGVTGTVWEVNGANTFSGGFELANNNGSTTILGNKSALGTGALRIGAGFTGFTLAANTDLSGANAIANTVNYIGGIGTATTTNAALAITAGSNVATLTGGTSPAVGDMLTAGSTNNLPAYTRVTAVSGSTITLSNAVVGAGSSITVTSVPFTTTNTQTLAIGGTQNITFAGTQNLTTAFSNGGTSTVALNVSNTGLTTFAGVLQQQGGVGGFSKTGAGTLQLTGNNTYAGATTVTQGVLLVNNLAGSGTGSGPLAINNGATLAGVGTVGGAAAIGAAASIAPGATTASIGTLNVSSATINGTLRVQYDVATGIDKLADAGALDISAATSALVLTNLGAGPLTAPSYVIASYGSLLGSAFGTVTGTPAGYTLNYGTGTNSTISLVLVPEPATLGAIGAASAVLLRRRRAAK